MRKSEIEAITLESVQEEILSRIPQEVNETGEVIPPSEERIQMEFHAYIQELLKVRRDELHEQFDKTNFAQGLYNLGHRVKNFKTFLGQLINQDSDILFELQTELDRMQAEIDSVAWLDARKVEYSKIDDLLKEALVEKELGDNSKWLEYVQLRNQIKLANPKPE